MFEAMFDMMSAIEASPQYTTETSQESSKAASKGTWKSKEGAGSWPKVRPSIGKATGAAKGGANKKASLPILGKGGGNVYLSGKVSKMTMPTFGAIGTPPAPEFTEACMAWCGKVMDPSVSQAECQALATQLMSFRNSIFSIGGGPGDRKRKLPGSGAGSSGGSGVESPKYKLHEAIAQRLERSCTKDDISYNTTADPRGGFTCTIEGAPGVLEGSYTNETPEPSKKAAEQAAAMVVLEAEFPALPVVPAKRKEMPKTLLVCTMQTLLKSSQKIEYTTVKTDGQYVSSIDLPETAYSSAQRFIGAPAPTEKDAENEAASAALETLGNIGEQVRQKEAEDRTVCRARTARMRPWGNGFDV